MVGGIFFWVAFVAGCATVGLAEPQLSFSTGSLVLSEENGAILSVTQRGAAQTLWKSDDRCGLWQAVFEDKSLLCAAQFHATNQVYQFSWREAPEGGLVLTYRAPELTAEITARSCGDGVEWRAAVQPGKCPLLQFDLPGRLRFSPDNVVRFIFPHDGNRSVGTAFNQRFFLRQPADAPARWEDASMGARNYEKLMGGPLEMHDLAAPAVELQVTDAGRSWLSAKTIASLGRHKVNRATRRAHAQRILVESPNGAYFAASNLGGTGAVWRIGSGVGEEDCELARNLVRDTVSTLIRSNTTARSCIGIIQMVNAREAGSWASVRVTEWAHLFATVAAQFRKQGIDCVPITTLGELDQALKASRYLAILNPYGECAPVRTKAEMPALLDTIRDYVRAGGNWFEVGGYSFYVAMMPFGYYTYGNFYPPSFADFQHLDAHAGSVSLYRVQPRLAHAPWDAATNAALCFVPGKLQCGADEQGGYCERSFNVYVRSAERMALPCVRMVVGHAAENELARYVRDNGLTRSLSEKVPAEKLETFKKSCLIYLGGPASEKFTFMDRLPVPSLIHFADYLKGGFDKEYPDHLPPHPKHGTEAEFKAVFQKAKALGHLISPYTNPTWWCDHPRGPTFVRCGEAPLLKGLDGKPHYEKYSANDGWTTTLWHPDVQAINREVRRQFTQDYPVDLLFQDQCGARRWLYDTNPASPTYYAYSEGMLAMNDEDSRVVPLGTESGWDRIMNYQTLFAGITWDIVPTEHTPPWVTLFKTRVAPDTWSIFPMAQLMAHDKVIFIHHDLGQFVTNDRVLAWSLGLGYSLSFRCASSALDDPKILDWVRWLDSLQKTLGLHYVGAPLTAFEHDRTPLFLRAGFDVRDRADDGVIRARYGTVQMSVNLGDVPRSVEGRTLAAYGFYATAPDTVAAALQGQAAYTLVKQGPGLYEARVFARDSVPVVLPVAENGVTFRVSGGAFKEPFLGVSKEQVLTLALPKDGTTTFTTVRIEAVHE